MRPRIRVIHGLLAALACYTFGCTRPPTPEARAAHAAPARHAPDAPAKESAASLPADDADADGLPDRAELRSYNDRENFRRWFTAVAESQFYHASESWNAEQRDCAGLVRFAAREALRPHDRLWFRRMGQAAYEQVGQVAPDVRAAGLERGPLGERIFRTRAGAFQDSDLRDGTFSDFADARTLKDYNCTYVGRERRQARPGDLLFFNQGGARKFPFHVMIFLGAAREASEGADDWVVYHTGASPDDAGTVKKVRLAVLDRHPNPRWRPLAANRNFLGFYRLKMIDDSSR